MKAIALISGGLDSILAARLIKSQGIAVIPLYFKIPFCHLRAHSYSGYDLRAFIKTSLEEELQEIDISNEFLKLVLSPKFGFGSNMNPCIDCKILMLVKTKEMMPQFDAQFIVTGEVLGQRPMSQHKQALKTIEQKSGLSGLLLRPLSAKNISPTIPEEMGWVNRDKLLAFSGRTRKPQISLAREFNIIGYPNASGGCLLTDRQFSVRLRDLVKHSILDLRNVDFLKIGRHFRLGPNAKLIVGRNEEENSELEEKAGANDYLFKPDENVAGPTCLGLGNFNREAMVISAQIACRYSDTGENGIEVFCSHILGKVRQSLSVFPIEDSKLASLRI
jgi:tRNA U34 2-thiouridine synthase MnmA/TrmU